MGKPIKVDIYIHGRPEKEQYLGDGVYATWDGDGVNLDLRGQDSTTKIYLEPEVFESLVKFGYGHLRNDSRKEAPHG